MGNLTQETLTLVLITALIAFITGLFIGRATKGSANEKAISNAQKELNEYKKAVSEHFGKTADLVDNLTQSYKDVFDHLGSSAKSLLTEEQVKQHIASRSEKAITLSYIAEEVDAKTLSPTEQKEKASTVASEPSKVTQDNKEAVKTDDAETTKIEEKEEATLSTLQKEEKHITADKSGEQKSAELLKEVAKKTGTDS